MRRAAAALLTLLALLSATGCGDSSGADDEPTPKAPAAADDLGKHDGKPCPATLPETSGSGAAGGKPDLPAFDKAWICRYQVESWTRAGEPTVVGDADLAGLEALLGKLEPAPADQMCTMDLGPRYLLVLGDGTDLTGVVVDAYGCRDVRIAADPHAPAAAGTYTGPGLLEELTRIAGA